MVAGVYFPAAGDLCHGDPLLMPRPRRNEGVTLPGHRGIPIYNAGRIPDAARPIVRRSEPQKRPVASKKRLPRGPQLPQNLLAVASRPAGSSSWNSKPTDRTGSLASAH